MKTRSLTAMAVIVFSASLTACDGGGEAPVVTVTAPSPTPSAVVTPVVTPSATPSHFYTLDETWDLSPETQPQGSGCAPGSGLPDGIWFGKVDSWSTSEIAFDMECWWSGTGAEAEAASRGDEVNNDYYLTNDATTIRVVSIADGAFALKADVMSLSDPGSWVISTVAEVIADPGGTMPVAPDPLVWLAVNGGEVTSFAVQYVP